MLSDQRTLLSTCSKQKVLTCDSHAFAHMTSLTRVLILELGNIVDIFIDNDPGTVTLAMRGDILFAKCLCHGDGGRRFEE